jgi:hypothetical protein
MAARDASPRFLPFTIWGGVEYSHVCSHTRTHSPAQYALASSLHIAPSASAMLPLTKYRKAPVDFGPLSSEIVTVEADHPANRAALAAAAEPGTTTAATPAAAPLSASPGGEVLRGQHIRTSLLRESASAAQLAPSPRWAGKSHVILWKRKHIPPSIPRGNASFGYKETASRLPHQAPPCW